MRGSIQKRRKQFFALCLAFVLAIVQIVPMRLTAADYRVSYMDGIYVLTNASGDAIEAGLLLDASDSITYASNSSAVPLVTITYHDLDGTMITKDSEAATDAADNDKTRNLQTYSGIGGTQIADGAFRGWKVMGSILGSSGYVSDISLQAVEYSKSNITYELNGGTNGAANPADYYEGKESISLADAEKTGYVFCGWYLDSGFSNRITEISKSQTGDLTLYAKFAKECQITYELNGGTNGEGNPTTYIEGEGVTGFADAKKEGYEFAGWYMDAEYKIKITSIGAEEKGDITLYAKFIANRKRGKGSITVNDVYYGESIKPIVESATNGILNVTIEYKEKSGVDGIYSTTAPTKAGEYVAKATFAQTEEYYQVVATDDFSIKKRKGEGSISVADVGYGNVPNPVVSSSTNGTQSVTILYKVKNASDDSYTETKPSAIGIYTAKAIFAETEGYQAVVATTDFHIGFIEAPETPYQIRGTVGENQYYTSVVHIIPASGYLIATGLEGSYESQLEITSSTNSFSVYLKKIDTGEMTAAIEVPEIKIDKEAPVISNITPNSTVYGDEIEVVVTDTHLDYVRVNEDKVAVTDGKAVLKLSSENGEKEYTIRCMDEAGNKKECHIVVAAEWMKSKTIPAGNVYLFSKYTYQLSNGTWKVNGDSTVYSGNNSICVDNDGAYSFSNANE